MIRMQWNHYAKSLRTGTSATLLVPGPEDSGERECWPVLYLLHELSGDETSFARFSALERHVAEHRVVVVMPRIGRSFGMDTHSGLAYSRYLAWELPELVERLLPVSRSASGRAVAGVDAGGYGAFHLAITHPLRYAAAAALSAPLNLEALYHLPDEEIRVELESVFGPEEALEAGGYVLRTSLAARVGSGEPMPRLLQMCGAEDFLVGDNRRFASLAGRLNAPLLYREAPGEHDWTAWDAMLPQALSFLCDTMKPEKPD